MMPDDLETASVSELEAMLTAVLAEGEALEAKRGHMPSASFDACVNDLAGRECELCHELERRRESDALSDHCRLPC